MNRTGHLRSPAALFAVYYALAAVLMGGVFCVTECTGCNEDAQAEVHCQVYSNGIVPSISTAGDDVDFLSGTCPGPNCLCHQQPVPATALSPLPVQEPVAHLYSYLASDDHGVICDILHVPLA